MKILIDTHIFLWALADPSRINDDKRVELETLANTIYVSSVSIAEIMIKSSIGKLKVEYNPVEMVRQSGFELLDFRGQAGGCAADKFGVIYDRALKGRAVR